jgi:alpha-tubulin suppressor-like RCC1 family protein
MVCGMDSNVVFVSKNRRKLTQFSNVRTDMREVSGSYKFKEKKEISVTTEIFGKLVNKVCVGRTSVLILDTQGELFTWGKYIIGYNGWSAEYQENPVPLLVDFNKNDVAGDFHKIVDIACGNSHFWLWIPNIMFFLGVQVKTASDLK